VRAKLLQLWPDSTVTSLKRESACGALELARKHFGGARAGNHPPIRAVAPGQSIIPSSSQLSPTEERNPRSMNLDRMPLGKAIELMISEESRIQKALRKERANIQRAIEMVVAAWRRGGRLFYLGAGTSGRLGVLDASECPPTFSVPAEQVQGIIAGGQSALWKSIEGAEDNPAAGAAGIKYRGVNKKDVVIGIAASGRTPFVWGALSAAQTAGTKTILICFNPHLTIASPNRPDLVIAPELGPEILTGSTRLKAGTATKVILNMITTLAMVRLGKVMSNLMVDVKASNQKLRDRAVRIVQTFTGAAPDAARAALEKSGWTVKSAVGRLSK
jgi:N-acetylmuramic acid 6-phosphate etherase